MLSIPRGLRSDKTPTVNDVRVTPRARHLYYYLKRYGPVTPETAMRDLWGDAYLTLPWRNNFNQHLRMARRFAAERGEAIVAIGTGRKRPLIIVETRHA